MNTVIHHIKALEDNYIWLIQQGQDAIVIDPGQAAGVLDFLASRQLQLKAILITHHHQDHTAGVPDLLAQYPKCTLYAHQDHLNKAFDVHQLVGGESFELVGLTFLVKKTPGHTDNHLSYLVKIDGIWRIFCGDTLFSGGCGRVFTGTAGELFLSLQGFKDLPDDSLFYPAHEYTMGNLKFGLSVCCADQMAVLQDALDKTQALLDAGQISLPSSLEQEKQINVFLQPSHQIRQGLIDRQLLSANQAQQMTDEQVFAHLRELKNAF